MTYLFVELNDPHGIKLVRMTNNQTSFADTNNRCIFHAKFTQAAIYRLNKLLWFNVALGLGPRFHIFHGFLSVKYLKPLKDELEWRALRNNLVSASCSCHAT